jgi:hypothetical protein
MRMLKLLLAAAMIIGATTQHAAADSAAVTNYKQFVTQKVDAWSARMAQLNDTLSKLKLQLGMSVPTDDPQAFQKEVKDKIAGTQESMRWATRDLEASIGTATVSPPDKSEAAALPGFIKDLIKSKGIPFAKNVAFTPNISWNFKSGTLGSASGTITVTFANP